MLPSRHKPCNVFYYIKPVVQKCTCSLRISIDILEISAIMMISN